MDLCSILWKDDWFKNCVQFYGKMIGEKNINDWGCG